MLKQQERVKAVSMSEPFLDGSVSLERSMSERRSVREFTDESLSLRDLSQLLWAAQGITADWGGRTAPSAGALYPLEVYAVASRVRRLEPGVYHYLPGAHELHLVTAGDRRKELMAAALHQECVAGAPVVLVLAAVAERTSAKYGRRARRYVHMEVGHAAQNVSLQAAALGLGSVVVGAMDDAKVGRLVGVGKGEAVLVLLPVGRPAA